MGKSSKQQKTNVSLFTTSATATATAGILFSGFDDSSNAAYFALVTHGIDRHRLRIFNVRSGAVSNDYSSENKEKFTSLTWGNIVDGTERAADSQANGKRRSRETLQVVALGTHTGSIILYSLAHGSVVKRLANAHTTPVTDFVVNRAGTKGYSVAEDGYIVEWDIAHSKETGKWKVDEKHVRKLKLSHDETKLAVAGHTISLYSLKERQVVKKYTGHASAVKELLFSFEDDVLISIAEDDRYVNVWDAQTTNDNTNNLTVLTMENNVSHIDFLENEPSILAVSEDGLLGIWQNATAVSNSSTTKPRRKFARAMTRQPETNIKIVSSQSEDTLIPIISAKFVVSDNGKSVIIARGSSVRPFFEVVNYIDESSGTPLQDVVLTRKAVGNYLLDEQSKVTNMNATRQRYDEETAKVVGDSDLAVKQPIMNDIEAENDEKELSIEEKLRRMSEGDAQPKELNKTESRQPKKSVPVPAAGSLQQALVQALHTNDKALLEACLRHNDPQVIRSTVQRLPTTYVIPFLQQLIERFQEKPARGRTLMQWIKAILQVHTAYFMTVPDLINQLALFYQALDGRMKMFPRLLALKGRLDLIESQINTRQRYAANKDMDMENAGPANVYVEQDSDDEADADHQEAMASDVEAVDSEVEMDGNMAMEEDDDEEMVDAASEEDEDEEDED